MLDAKTEQQMEKFYTVLEMEAPDFCLIWQPYDLDRNEEGMKTDHWKCPAKLKDPEPSTYVVV